jgi:flagellar protein FliJ
MPRFRFNLQAVLDHREMIEEEKQKAVALLEIERARLEALIREYQRGILHEKSEMKASLRLGDIRAVRLQSGAAVRLAAAAQRRVLELSGLLKRLEEARAELLEATKRKKAVELLKERRYDEWRQELTRRELAAVDELAVMAAGRKDGEA